MKNKVISLDLKVMKIGYPVVEVVGGCIIAEGEYAIIGRIGSLSFFSMQAKVLPKGGIIKIPLVGTKTYLKGLVKTLNIDTLFMRRFLTKQKRRIQTLSFLSPN